MLTKSSQMSWVCQYLQLNKHGQGGTNQPTQTVGDYLENENEEKHWLHEMDHNSSPVQVIWDIFATNQKDGDG